MSDLSKNMPERLPVPYSSPQARTYGAEDIYRGEQSLFFPDEFKKDDAACPLSDLLFEIGRASGRERNELLDAQAAIPESLAPLKDTTLGGKTPLAERIKVVLAAHDARVSELLEANNREVERRREVERELAEMKGGA